MLHWRLAAVHTGNKPVGVVPTLGTAHDEIEARLPRCTYVSTVINVHILSPPIAATQMSIGETYIYATVHRQ